MIKPETSEGATRARRLIRLPEVLSRTGKGRTSWLDAVKSGAAPRPVKIGARSVAWDSCEVDNWIANRPSAR